MRRILLYLALSVLIWGCAHQRQQREAIQLTLQSAEVTRAMVCGSSCRLEALDCTGTLEASSPEEALEVWETYHQALCGHSPCASSEWCKREAGVIKRSRENLTLGGGS